ncbi:MAG TPA: molybdenum cofactor guanylyltransferase, partial [Candidatus Limnocylindrales bacterium]
AGVGRDRVTGIVLAGGRSSRFGTEKLAATSDGQTLLERAVERVESVAGTILIAGPVEPTTRFRHVPPVRFIDDAEPFAGPLAALAGTLREIATEFAIVVGADMPGLVPAVLQSMLDRLAMSADIDAVLLDAVPGDARGDGPPKQQVLPVALRVGPASETAAASLAAGDRSLVRFLGRLRVAEIPVEEWLQLDPVGESTFDIDIPVDLERFRAREIR